MLLDGKAPLPGQVIKHPELAKTFRTLVELGKDGFYKGRIAEAIVELIKSKGGVMELEDLAKHETSIVEPIRYTYGGEITLYEVYSCLRYLFPRYEINYLFIVSARPTVKVSRLLVSAILACSTDTDDHRDHCASGTWYIGKYPGTRQDKAAARDGAQLCRISAHTCRSYAVSQLYADFQSRCTDIILRLAFAGTAKLY